MKMNRMHLKAKWVITGIAAVVVGLQFTTPAHTNPPSDEMQGLQKSTTVPSGVLALFERSCYDCHSNTTDWRWYTYVAPVSWYTVGHVNTGRAKLNFSLWGTYSAHKKDNRLEGICDQCQRGEMPLPSYALIHPQVKLSPDDVSMICAWASTERSRLASAQAR